MLKPKWIVHYNRSEPFRSVTGAPEETWSAITRQMTESTTWGLARFADENYLPRRKVVEAKLREMFIEKGGHPELHHPTYCFLGRNERFEQNAANQAYLIELSDVDPDQVSFTYGDSLLAFDDDYRAMVAGEILNPLCRQVFTLADLESLLADLSLHRGQVLPIEAHLWVYPTKFTPL